MDTTYVDVYGTSQKWAPADKVFFISDTHFGHANIIKFCDRPFSSVKEMDAEMIRRWNDVVSDDDHVFHLGDISLSERARDKRVEDLLWSLNGHIHLIKGNHDHHSVFQWGRFSTVTTSLNLFHSMSDIPIFLKHEPQRVWDYKEEGGLHFHGHIHSKKPFSKDRPGAVDVGVDAWGTFAPIGFLEIIDAINDDHGYIPMEYKR